MPAVARCMMAATGSPGIRRGRMKLSTKAKTKVTRNQTNLLRKYFRYPFNAIPPWKEANSHVPRVCGTWLFLQDYGLRINKHQVIETCDTPTVRQIERRNGRVGTITLVREACPNALVHSMERLRTIHEREGGDVGQVDLDQFRVGCLQFGGIG